jgi:hypothetical protein
MEELKTESTKHLTVDSDWMTAVVTLVILLFSLLAALGTGWRLVSGAPFRQTQISWYQAPALLIGIYLVFSVKDRAFRWGVALMLLSTVSRVALRLLHASVATQALNEMVMRAVNLTIYIGGVIYLLHWFWARTRYV